MKKIMMGLLVMTLALTGCGKEEKEKIEETQKEVINDPVEFFYGTWTITHITKNGSVYSTEELETLGDDSLSGIWFVIKEGNSVYSYDEGNDEEAVSEWNYDKDSDSIAIGSLTLVKEGEMLKIESSAYDTYLEKYSESQDITKIPKKDETVEETKETAAEEPAKEETTDDDTIRPEVKEAIDAFESFIDEYCEFMKKYVANNGSDLSLLADYAKFVAKLASMEEKMDGMEGDLNDAETKYYTEVMLRCDQKMLSCI